MKETEYFSKIYPEGYGKEYCHNLLDKYSLVDNFIKCVEKGIKSFDFKIAFLADSELPKQFRTEEYMKLKKTDVSKITTLEEAKSVIDLMEKVIKGEDISPFISSHPEFSTDVEKRSVGITSSLLPVFYSIKNKLKPEDQVVFINYMKTKLVPSTK